MRLHELPGLQRYIDSMIDEADGEITPVIEIALDGLDEELGHKVDWVATVIAEREARAEGYKAEIARLVARKKAEERAALSLQQYLQKTMEAMGIRKAEGALFKAALQTAGRPKIVWVEDHDKLPEGFRRVTVEPDLKAAQEAFDQGCLPDGFQASYTTSLRIR